MNSLYDEWKHLLGAPYKTISFGIATIVTILTLLFFPNNQIEEGKVAVIDLDNSRYSREIINKLDSSKYINVVQVLNFPVEAESLLYHDAHIAVIYLPKDLEKNRWSNQPNNIGALYDNSNISQNANLKVAIGEIIASENSDIGVPKIRKLGLNSEQSSAVIGNLKLQDRLLFNPVNSYTGTLTIGYIYLFTSMMYGMATLTIIVRLRMQKQWEDELKRTPLALVLRLVPYMACFIATVTFCMGFLKYFFDFRFSGNFFAYLPSMIIYTTALGILCMILAWKAPNPMAAAQKAMIIMPTGMILGGLPLARGIFPLWLQDASYVLPLVWQSRFIRDFASRGVPFNEMIIEYIHYLFYAIILFGVLSLLFYKEEHALSKK